MLKSAREPLLAFSIVLLILAVACEDSGEKPPPVASPTAASTTPTPPPSAPPGPTTFRVLAGATNGAIDIEQFMPATVRIREGDTVTWIANGYESHTVTFIASGRLDIFGDYLVPAPDEPGALEFNPRFALPSEAQGTYDGTQLVNSGFFGALVQGEYSLTFPKAGVYSYICVVHLLHMRGVVAVEEAGAVVPAPEAVIAEAEAERRRFAEEALAAAEAMEARRAAEAEPAGGGRAYQVSAGLDTPQSQVLSFLPASLNIEVGDTVVFWNSDRDFHNVIFAPEGQPPPQWPIIKPGEKGGYRLIINPRAVEEIPPPPDFGPEHLFSSGTMGGLWPRVYWQVTFPRPGVYHFYCTLHTLAGMAGVITVRERGAP